MGVLSKLRASGGHFLRDDERGNATIETVLWIPVYVLFFSLLVDASLLFNAQAHLTKLAQDANRRYSIGLLGCQTQTQQYIMDRLGSAKDAPRTQITVNVEHSVISTEIQVDAGLYMAVGFFDLLDHIQLRVRSQHYKEVLDDPNC